jgi:hypothetical protein
MPNPKIDDISEFDEVSVAPIQVEQTTNKIKQRDTVELQDRHSIDATPEGLVDLESHIKLISTQDVDMEALHIREDYGAGMDFSYKTKIGRWKIETDLSKELAQARLYLQLAKSEPDRLLWSGHVKFCEEILDARYEKMHVDQAFFKLGALTRSQWAKEERANKAEKRAQERAIKAEKRAQERVIEVGKRDQERPERVIEAEKNVHQKSIRTAQRNKLEQQELAAATTEYFHTDDTFLGKIVKFFTGKTADERRQAKIDKIYDERVQLEIERLNIKGVVPQFD